MSGIETVQALLADIEACQWDRARSHVTDDFTFGGAVPQPVSADVWLGIHKALAGGIPDLTFNPSGFREEGDKVYCQLQLKGTQTRELTMPIPGVAPVPPTGKSFTLPVEPTTATMRGDKVASFMVNPVPGGGVAGLLAQLGVTIPAHP